MVFKKIKENSPILIFSSFNLLHRFALFLIIPFFSIILYENGWQTKEITYFFAIFSFATFLFSPIVGKISDFIGRKKIILFGLFFQICVMMLYYFFIDEILFIYFVRFFDALFFVCIGVVALGGFQDLIRKNRGFWTGVYESLGTIGTILGPIAAGYIATTLLVRDVFIFGIIFSIFCILLLLFLPEKKIKHRKILKSDFDILKDIKNFLSFRKLKAMAILGILANSLGHIYVIFFPIYVLETLGTSEYILGILLAIPGLLHVFQVFYGKISDLISAEFGCLLGILFYSLPIFLLPFVSSIPYLVLLLIIFGIGGGIWNVNAWSLMCGIAEKKRIQGEIIGSYFSIVTLGVAITTLLSGYIVEYIGIVETLQLFAGFVLGSMFFVYFIIQPIFHNKNNIFYKILERKN